MRSYKLMATCGLTFTLAVPALAQPVTTNIKLHYQDNSDNEAGFRAYLVAGNPPIYTKVGEVGANVVDIPVVADLSTQPCYVARAFNSIGESADSNKACAIKPMAPGTTTIVIAPTMATHEVPQTR